MKILIAYDGSEGSKAAIEDLRIAGLSETGVEARVLSVGEYVFPPDSIFYADSQIPISSYTPGRISEMSKYALDAANSTADEGLRRVRELFPRWEVEALARLSSPASTILDIAGAWKPDLVVIGSHGRSALGRIFMGSVSLRVVNEAACPVRVVKHLPRNEVVSGNAGLKIVLAFDGSEGSRQAVHSLVHRSWPAGTALHVVAVADTSMLGSLDFVSLISPALFDVVGSSETRLEHLMHSIESEMKKYFQTVTNSLILGSPSKEIVSEAKRLNADMIFIGSHGHSRGLAKLERLVSTIGPTLGSVAYGVSAHANATVEVVRQQNEENET
jgi:nucleotide-binding universal stress UspA family protein